MKFLELPVAYWSVEALIEIASVVWMLMYTDHFSTHSKCLLYARVLVDVDAS